MGGEMVLAKLPMGAVLAGALAISTGQVGAAAFTDAEFAAGADDGCRSVESWSEKHYRKPASEDGGKSDVEAVGLERLSDNPVLIVYAGTNPKDIKDVLADLGIGAKEAEYVLKSSVETIVRGLASTKIIKSAAVDKTIAAMEGTMSGLKVATAKAAKKGSPKFSCPKGTFFDLVDKGIC
jgi:hypothetical protein